MDYSEHRITKIKYKVKSSGKPRLDFYYNALSESEGIRKKAHDTYEEEPHPDFRHVWERLIDYWKENVMLLLADSIEWNIHDARPTTIVLDHNNKGRIVSVQYFVTVENKHGESVSISPPKLPPGDEYEVSTLRELHNEAIAFLQGKRAQGDMFAMQKTEDDEWVQSMAN
jgi:hypothetical protein